MKKLYLIRGVTLVALLAFFIHFVFLFCSSCHYSWIQEDLYYLSDRYTDPQFNQTWKLFVPMHKDNSSIEYKVYSDGAWSEFYSLEDDFGAVQKPFAQRINRRVTKFLAYETRENTDFDEEDTPGYRSVKSSKIYANALNICMRNARKRYPDIDSISMILKRDLTPKPGFTQVKPIIDIYGAEAIK